MRSDGPAWLPGPRERKEPKAASYGARKEKTKRNQRTQGKAHAKEDESKD